MSDCRPVPDPRIPRFDRGYNNHGSWSTLGEIRELEVERENEFPDLPGCPDETPAIWVTRDPRKALRYAESASEWDRIDGGGRLTREERETLRGIAASPIEILPTDVLAEDDGDDGYLVLRPDAAPPGGNIGREGVSRGPMADDPASRIQCWAAGVRVREDLQRLQETADKLVALTGPGEHDPLEVAAREKEVGKLVEQIQRDADDSVACGGPTGDEKAPPGMIPPRTWISSWRSYGGTALGTADPHARYVALSQELPRVTDAARWMSRDAPRPGGSPPQGQVTMKLGPKGKFLYTPRSEEDLETAKHLEEFLSGNAKLRTGAHVVDHLYRDGVLEPALSDALAHLRSVLAAVTEGTESDILIDWTDNSRVLDVSGYADAYKGTTWKVQLTPNYTVQNQREIADYVRHYEGAIADEVRLLLPRKRRSSGWNVEFYATHPGVQYSKHIEVGPPEHERSYSYMLPDYHSPESYTPPDFGGTPAHPFGGGEPPAAQKARARRS